MYKIWFGNTGSKVPYIREVKTIIMKALVIGMGLEWPDGEYEVRGDTVLLRCIMVPDDRIKSFFSRLMDLNPDLSYLDIGSVDCESEEAAGYVPRGIQVEIIE